MQPEQVILVDINDREIGIGEKWATHREAKLHRAFSVFIFRERDGHYETLLQQRNLEKYHSPGLWTNACCSHPKPGEDILTAAPRRLNEELGIEVPLTKVGVFHYKAEVGNGLTENEIDHVFIGFMQGGTLTINSQEVAACRWIALDALNLELANNPKSFTVWFKQALTIALEKL